jgi:hypothetical protein
MSFTPGQTIKCTINTAPRAAAPKMTISRLMRRDPAIAKGLRKAQDLRRRRMHAYVRGGRVWYDREKAARIARVAPGNSWTMPWTPELDADLASVSGYLTIENA